MVHFLLHYTENLPPHCSEWIFLAFFLLNVKCLHYNIDFLEHFNSALHEEIQYLHKFANFNLFPNHQLSELIYKLLNNFFLTNLSPSDIPKQNVYLKIPYIGQQYQTYKFDKTLFATNTSLFQFVFTPIIHSLKILNLF